MSKGDPVSIAKGVFYLRAVTGAKNRHLTVTVTRRRLLCVLGLALRIACLGRIVLFASSLTNKIQSMRSNQIADTSALIRHVELVQYFIHQATHL